MEGVLEIASLGIEWRKKKRSKGNVKHVCFSAFIGQVDREGLNLLR